MPAPSTPRLLWNVLRGTAKLFAFDPLGMLEITRVCTLGHDNACSRLYGALCRAGAALGYRSFITYTLESEPGTSLKAAGFEPEANLPERSWAEEIGRDRYEENLLGERIAPEGRKIRWRRSA